VTTAADVEHDLPQNEYEEFLRDQVADPREGLSVTCMARFASIWDNLRSSHGGPRSKLVNVRGGQSGARQ
jgi:hypothetical protein